MLSAPTAGSVAAPHLACSSAPRRNSSTPAFKPANSLSSSSRTSTSTRTRQAMSASAIQPVANGSGVHKVSMDPSSDAASSAITGNMAGYTFPESKFRWTLNDPAKTPLVLVACGSFSPITYLHMRMFEMAADYIKRETDFELVAEYLSPVADAYKKAGLASAYHRINMCELAAAETNRLMVDAWEANQPEYTRTAIVLDRFDHEINTVRGGVTAGDGEKKACRIAMLAGADLIGTMSTPGVWSPEDLDHILGRYGAFIVERSGTHMEDALENLKTWTHNIWVIEQKIKNDVSSTLIRQFLKKDLSVRYLIPPPVISYIEEHGLYDEDNKRPHSRSRSHDNGGPSNSNGNPRSPTSPTKMTTTAG